jgi:uncharacterized membrane-anchored protein YhcB (DUF1043 family)
MTTFDDQDTDIERVSVPGEAAPVAPGEASAVAGTETPSRTTARRRRRTWPYVISALALIVAVGIGYAVGFTTSGASNAKSERNHARSALAKAQTELNKTQQDLTTARAQTAAAQNDLATEKAKQTACSTYAASLEKTVATGASFLQAVNDYEATQPGSAAETAASDRADRLYTQMQQNIGSSQALAPACKGTAT